MWSPLQSQLEGVAHPLREVGLAVRANDPGRSCAAAPCMEALARCAADGGDAPAAAAGAAAGGAGRSAPLALLAPELRSRRLMAVEATSGVMLTLPTVGARAEGAKSAWRGR